MQLDNRKLVLGVTGSIAAYKACELLRLFVKGGADVYVAETEAACRLVAPATFEALSGHKVSTEIFNEASDIGHIELSAHADLIVIAPASAQTIAKLAAGMADNMLTATVLAAPCRTVIAPAMNSRMYLNPATQANLETLRKRGFIIISPEEGELACGTQGVGRMRPVEDIYNIVCALLNPREGIAFAGFGQYLPSPEAPLSLAQTRLLPKAQGAGLKVVITAGPTEEPIDPVRVITNKSSGKMGYALAEAARAAGADVTLISGPTHLPCPQGVKRINVRSAADMLNAVKDQVTDAQVVIGCAAVSDYRLAYVYDKKITKDETGDSLTLTLIKNEDIISYVGHLEKRPFTVGFAAETDHAEEHAKEKLTRKNLDLIVLNDVSRQDIGFNSDDNAVSVFDCDGKVADLDKAPKSVIASRLVDLIFEAVRKGA